MIKRGRILFACFFVLLLSLSSAEAAETLRVGYANAEGAKIPVFLAKEYRLFDKQGLDVRMTRVATGRFGAAKLASGEIQLFLGNSGAVLEAIAVQKAPLVIIASLGRERLAIYTRPGIARVEELKGKRFGVSGPGAANDRVAARALKKLGFEPGGEMQIVATGRGDPIDRLQSLIAGKVDAVAATTEDLFELAPEERAKMRRLVDLADYDILVSGADIAVGRAFLNAQRGTVRRFLQAVEEALDVARKRPDFVAAAYEKYAGSSDRKTLDLKVAEYYAGKPPERPYPDKRALASMLEQLRDRHPEIKNEDFTAYIDESLYP